MILRKIIPSLIVYSCVALSAVPQKIPKLPLSSTVEHTLDFVESVVPISSVELFPSAKLGITGKLGPTLHLDADFGTGFCLDAPCRFIATNYHVAVTSRVRKIKGEKIVQRYLATGPNDNGATANTFPSGKVFPYVKKRDLAIFELRSPLHHHHGLSFSLENPEVGQEVDIYGYPHGIINPIRKLTRFPATFKGLTTSGFLAFDYQLHSDKPLQVRGASGGIVVDRRTEKILGVLSETNETTALAVPVQTLVEFVTRVQPFLAQKIFPKTDGVSPVSADLYPKFQPRPDNYPKFVPISGTGLQHRPEEPNEVSLLRKKAQLLADSMRNFIAVQSFAWGSGDKEPSAEASYEVRFIDGVQRFRSYPEGEEELTEATHPRQNGWVLPAAHWSKLPTMVGSELLLRIRQAADTVVNERQMKVFQYYASVEDNLCPFEPVEDYALFKISKTVAVACYGEVWTDEDTNIVRISEHLELSDKLKAYQGWEECQVVITYGWLRLADETTMLVPLTIFTEARDKRRVYWCRGQFTDYQKFASRVRIVESKAPNTPSP